MTWKVNNISVIRDLASKTYRAGRKRNFLTIFAIFLTTLLVTVVLGVGISYYQALSQRQLRMEGMDFDVILPEPTEEQVEKVRSLDQVVSAGLMVKCAIVQQYEDLELDKLQLWWMDETCWEQQFIPALEFYEGSYPKERNEIMLSTYVLSQLGITEPQVGMTLPLTYYILAEGANQEDTVTEDFVLSGYYRDYTSLDRGYISEAFYQYTGARQTDDTQGRLNIKLTNSLLTTSDLMELQIQLDLSSTQILQADTDSTETFLKTLAILFLLFIMILVSGYLFIYNTLYISIARDIRYYGQLKTLGTTSRQLRSVIYRCMVRNALWGILLGLLAGYSLSGLVVPKILGMVASTVSEQVLAPPPFWICIPAAAISFLTNWLGTRQPAKMAGECSPIEAMRYIGLTKKSIPRRKKECKTKSAGAGIPAMARREMFRNRKQAAVILLSFITAVTLVLVVCVVLRQNDARVILNATLNYDLTVTNTTQYKGTGDITTEKLEELRQIPGIAQVRAVTNEKIIMPYQEEAFGNYFKSQYGGRYLPGNYEERLALYLEHPESDYFTPRIIGMDEAEFEIINQYLGGILDWTDFESSPIAVATCNTLFSTGTEVTADQMLEQFRQEITGKEVYFYTPEGKNPQERHTVTVEAVLDSIYCSHYLAGGSGGPTLYVSETYLEQLIDDPLIERVYVVYDTPFSQETEQQVKDVFAGYKTVSFESKISRYEEMRDGEAQVKLLGGCLALVIALLAVLNYCNMMAVGVQDRAREFASLESIGMTRRQTQQMLALEGIGYALISFSIALVISLPVSYLVFQMLNIYYVNYYSFPWGICLLFALLILALCAAVPVLLYRASWKGSLVDRLRESE